MTERPPLSVQPLHATSCYRALGVTLTMQQFSVNCSTNPLDRAPGQVRTRAAPRRRTATEATRGPGEALRPLSPGGRVIPTTTPAPRPSPGPRFEDATGATSVTLRMSGILSHRKWRCTGVHTGGEGWRRSPVQTGAGGLVLAPQVGFEPTTNRLTADRSTTELLRSVEAASMGRRRTSECDGWLIVAPAHLPRQR